MSKPTISKIEKQNEKKRNKYKINKTQTFAKMKQFFLGLILFKDFEKLLNEMTLIFIKDKEISRPGRSFPRTSYATKKRKFHFSYKPIT